MNDRISGVLVNEGKDLVEFCFALFAMSPGTNSLIMNDFKLPEELGRGPLIGSHESERANSRTTTGRV